MIMCVFAITAASAQINSVAIVGAAVGGWPTDNDCGGPVDQNQMNRVGTTDEWILENVEVTTAFVDGVQQNGLKFRANNCWNDATGDPVGLNVGKPASGNGWPSGTGTNAGSSTDIKIGVVAGTYTVKFNSSTLEYSFEGGPPIPVVKLVGTAVFDGTANIAPTSPTTFQSILTLLDGDAAFEVDGVLLSDGEFPYGLASEGVEYPLIPVIAGKWIVKYDYETSEYSFDVAPNDAWAITGSALKTFGYDWGTDLLLETTDGITYTSSAPISMEAGGFKFRIAGNWDSAKGCDASDDNQTGFFPTGLPGGKNINVTAEQAGSYSVTFNANTGEYSFTTLSTKGFSSANFKVSPNPTTNNWNFTTANDSIESIQILDVLGKKVMSISPKSNTANVDASALTRGIYFAKVATAKATQTLKLIKN